MFDSIDEIHFLIYHSYTDASFSESLYGLRRRAAKIRTKQADVQSKSSDGIQHSSLQKRQRVLSVVFLVVLHLFFPFFLIKMFYEPNNQVIY